MSALTVAQMSTMTAREYVVGLGLAKPSRGRMSPFAYAAIEKAEKEGVVFQESESAKYQAELAQRRANGEVIKRGRKSSGVKKTIVKPVTERRARILTEEHKAAMQAGRLKAKAEASGEILPLEAHEIGGSYSEEWYQKTFKVGSYVCQPTGGTLQVLRQKDAAGFTHFVDSHGKKCKAKVNAMWGVRKGFPVKTGYIPNNAA